MATDHSLELVRSELENLNLSYSMIELGEVELLHIPSEEQHKSLILGLKKWNLELIQDRKAILVERTKNIIKEMVYFSNEFPKINYSHFLSQKLQRDYTYLSNIFSELEGITIEHFIIFHKIEKGKQLLMKSQLNITEIAVSLNYRDVAHFSNQFKKVSGHTPTFFKAMMNKKNR
jgi:YesN/AraC family two-component response regulator